MISDDFEDLAFEKMSEISNRFVHGSSLTIISAIDLLDLLRRSKFF